jgi:hypothetical protein
MGKIKSLSIASDPAPHLDDLKTDDLASQLLFQLFYGKRFSLSTHKDDVTEEIPSEEDKQLEEIQEKIENVRV